MYIKIAAKQYHFRRSTLGLHRRRQTPRKGGRSATVLSAAQENDLVGKIHRLAEFGMPITRFECKAYFLTHLSNPFTKVSKRAGGKCLKILLSRHLDTSKRRAQQLNMARVQQINKPMTDDYFH